MRLRSEWRHHSLDQVEDISEEVEEDESTTRRRLLLSLKSTACGVLGPGLVSPWSTYGGLSRMCNCMRDVLNHGLKQVQTPTRMSGRGFWPFVRGLRWLCPTLAPSLEAIYRQSRINPSLEPGDIWLEDSLRDLNLSAKLSILVENTHHLEHYYHDEAYLCNKECYSSMLICLRAVEKNDPALLADVNPNMLQLNRPTMVRSTSLPLPTDASSAGAPWAPSGGRRRSDHRLAPMFASPPHSEPLQPARAASEQRAMGSGSNDRSSPGKDTSARQALASIVDYTESGPDVTSYTLDLTSRLEDHAHPLANEPLHNMEIASLEPKRKHSLTKSRSRTESQTKGMVRSDSKDSKLLDQILNEEDIMDSDKNSILSMDTTFKKMAPVKTHKRAHSDFAVQGMGAKKEGEISTSFPTGRRNTERRHSLMEEGGRCVVPMTECYFPRPRKGQSLRSFLKSQDFHTCAELDKENAHFNISEALIAAIEQMKWAHVLRPDSEGESDEEIQELRQRIRIRKRERMTERSRVIPFSDGRTTTTSTASTASDQDGLVWSGESASSDGDVDMDVTDASETSNLTSLQQSGLSLSMASLYSDADIQKSNEEVDNRLRGDRSDCSTAESVAISLLRQFSEQQLPKASDIQWLVSEEDAPQALLPMPDSMPVSPDEADEYSMTRIGGPTRIRGNFEWAPPRAQIIFSIHVQPKRKQQIAKQNYRCAGCGTRVEPGYEKRFRYCDYLGKFFCQCCHVNQMSSIPSRVLQKWDFAQYPVSNFSYELIQRMSEDPLFNVADVNPLLYRKVKVLEFIRDYRVQLYHIQGFLQTCRMASSLYDELQNCPPHWVNDPDVYSLQDLLQAKTGELTTTLRDLVTGAVCHISSCELCRARGFICELCDKNQDLLFPFELNRVVSCSDCRSCYHITCYTPGKCPRCARLKARRLHQERSLPATPEESDDDEDDDDDAESSDQVFATLTKGAQYESS